MGWAIGDSVVIRDIRNGVVYFAWPKRVVGVRDDGVLLGQRPGAIGRVPVGYPHDRSAMLRQLGSPAPELGELEWTKNITLALCAEGGSWTTRLFWDAASSAFLGYYVDFIRPFCFGDHTVDMSDLA